MTVFGIKPHFIQAQSLLGFLSPAQRSTTNPPPSRIDEEEEGLEYFRAVTQSAAPQGASAYFTGAPVRRPSAPATEPQKDAEEPEKLRPPIRGYESAKSSPDSDVRRIAIHIQTLLEAIAQHGPEHTKLWQDEVKRLVKDPSFKGLLTHYQGVYPGDPSGKGKHDYLRRSILVDEKRGVELVLIHWRGGQSSRVHDHTHGDKPAYGVEVLLNPGKGFLELRFEREEGQPTRVTAQELKAGQPISVGPTLHQILNTDEETSAFTFIVYAWEPDRDPKTQGVRERTVSISPAETAQADRVVKTLKN